MALVLWFRDADGEQHRFFLPEADESEMLLVVSQVPDGTPIEKSSHYDIEPVDLMGLDRYVDLDGKVSLNIGHWENYGDLHNVDWFPVLEMNDEYMTARTTSAPADADERSFRRRPFNPTP